MPSENVENPRKSENSTATRWRSPTPPAFCSMSLSLTSSLTYWPKSLLIDAFSAASCNDASASLRAISVKTATTVPEKPIISARSAQIAGVFSSASSTASWVSMRSKASAPSR